MDILDCEDSEILIATDINLRTLWQREGGRLPKLFWNTSKPSNGMYSFHTRLEERPILHQHSGLWENSEILIAREIKLRTWWQREGGRLPNIPKQTFTQNSCPWVLAKFWIVFNALWMPRKWRNGPTAAYQFCQHSAPSGCKAQMVRSQEVCYIGARWIDWNVENYFTCLNAIVFASYHLHRSIYRANVIGVLCLFQKIVLVQPRERLILMTESRQLLVSPQGLEMNLASFHQCAWDTHKDVF